MTYAVIMAGGSGQRLWPRSRARRPKQALALGGPQPLLRQAVERLVPALDLAHILVITTRDLAGVTREVLPELPPENLLLEPVGRNTAPCVGLAALVISRRDPDATMAVLSADHVIRPAEAFRAALEAGRRAVEEDPRSLVCFGVVPAGVSTQLGHIRRGAKVAEFGGVTVYEARGFIEKPPQAEAEKLVASGTVLWNLGIFVWKAARILDELRTHRPALAPGLDRIARAIGTQQFEPTVAEVYPTLEKISIDYAVMEKAERVLVVEGRFLWDDVGTWQSLSRVCEADGSGNVVLGPHVGIDTKDCVIACEPGTVVGTIGVQGLVIVQTPDAVLVCPRDRAGEVRELVERLRAQGLDKHI